MFSYACHKALEIFVQELELVSHKDTLFLRDPDPAGAASASVFEATAA